jgi:preprotein translocase subunit SecG
MLGFFIVLLTAILLLNCVILVLLVLMQLPKKEAGAGLAFGGAATDALFGAGSGNFLTKATKYSAALFFALSIILSVLQPQFYHRSDTKFRQGVENQGRQAGPVGSPEAVPTTPTPALTATPTNVPILKPMPMNVQTNPPPK